MVQVFKPLEVWGTPREYKLHTDFVLEYLDGLYFFTQGDGKKRGFELSPKEGLVYKVHCEMSLQPFTPDGVTPMDTYNLMQRIYGYETLDLKTR